MDIYTYQLSVPYLFSPLPVLLLSSFAFPFICHPSGHTVPRTQLHREGRLLQTDNKRETAETLKKCIKQLRAALMDTPTEFDSQTPHLKTMLGLMGISDVEVVFAEGLNMGDAHRDAALKEAFQAIDQLVEAL